MQHMIEQAINQVASNLDADIFESFSQAVKRGLIAKRGESIHYRGWDIETYDGAGIVLTVANCPTHGLDCTMPLSVKTLDTQSINCLTTPPKFLSVMFQDWLEKQA